ncbi:MAG: TetR/AcrR family transcriptional regulator [Bacteroidota bacterium]
MSPRTPKQFEEIREEKKALIMENALQLFATETYNKTSMSQVAKKSGISKGLIYNYFESKEELLKTILNSTIDEMLKIYDPNQDGVLDEEELEYFINESFNLLASKRNFWKLYYQVIMQPEAFMLIEERINQLYQPIYTMAINYFKKKGFENPEMEALLFGTLLDGICMDYIMKPEWFPLEEIKKELIKRYCKK